MAAVTAVHNPLKKDEVLLFYCAPDQQVYVNRYNESGDSLTIPFAAEASDTLNTQGINFGRPLPGAPPIDGGSGGGGNEDGPPKGVVKNPSAFGWVLFRNLLCVYGIRTDGMVCIVSPEFRPLKGTPIAKANSLAACGDGKTGWLYYLGNNPQYVVEYRLEQGAFSVKSPKPDNNSQLCAYYNSLEKKRYCIFQLNDTLHHFEAASGTTTEISNSDGARSLTPMAICMAQSKRKAYLYYSNKHSRLLRIDYTTEDGWGSAHVVKDAQELSDTTHLSAIPSSDESAILVYYITSGGSGNFYQLTDNSI